VGIAWSGNPVHKNDRKRSIPLAQFRQLAADGWQFVSLQPDVRESDRAAFEAWPGLVDAGRELRDFADTAGLLQALDLVITVDTSVAHLAGALGRPVWILLPYSPDWRWLMGRSDTPWYPGARLYRQPATGAWAPVLARVRGDLQAAQAPPQ
jgi:ADP-heptose:LPS heptosyltransferase